ncbi:hypothetical protein ACH5A7_03680 [Streptomyces sp. NPDC018955]|uniref:hypothetical protein n=1 Tax=Streptomyces sp. NPDC018955 TaxID=3365055 RepID=UPI0037AA32D1
MPWAVVGLWLAALVLVGPLAGKVGEVQQDRAVDCLPDSADSTATGPRNHADGVVGGSSSGRTSGTEVAAVAVP